MIPLIPSPGRPNTVSTPQSISRSTSSSDAIFAMSRPRDHWADRVALPRSLRLSRPKCDETPVKRKCWPSRRFALSRVGNTSRTRPRLGRSSMDAITLLKQDHKAVDGMFKKFEQAGDRAHKTKRKLVDQIITELAVHTAIEEQLFYPTIRDRVESTEDEVLESLEEHHILK